MTQPPALTPISIHAFRTITEGADLRTQKLQHAIDELDAILGDRDRTITHKNTEIAQLRERITQTQQALTDAVTVIQELIHLARTIHPTGSGPVKHALEQLFTKIPPQYDIPPTE